MDLGQRLRDALRKISGKPYIDEAGVKDLVKELQRILISSDVNVKLVFQLSKNIEKRALESDKREALSLKEHVLKVVYDELVKLMGETYTPRLTPHKVLLLGLYGSGKTTTCGKLAHFYKTRGLKVGLIGADTDRPAAQDQLGQLATKVGVDYYTTREEKDPREIVKKALNEAARAKDEIIIVDSAGRSAFDSDLSREIKDLHSLLKPEEVFLVVSGDIGQVAGKQAEEFKNAVPISGVIVTKMDGSGKGGGALSSVAASGAKISFIGIGEKTDEFEVYNSEKFVGRLLGVPDIEGLLEKVKKISDEEDLKRMESDELTIETFYEQLKAAKKMGPLGNVLSMMGGADIPKDMVRQSEEKLKQFEAMINSMSRAEKKNPSLIRKESGRADRIAKGSGRSRKEVLEFLSQFEKMEKMFRMMKGNRGMRKKLEQMMSKGGLKGGLPPMG